MNTEQTSKNIFMDNHLVSIFLMADLNVFNNPKLFISFETSS